MMNDKETIGNKKGEKDLNRSVHMANERTFLAWIRTSIGIMAFGFVLEKFALFMKQMALFVRGSTPEDAQLPSHEYSAILGIILVALGAIITALAYLRYLKVAQQIEEDTWKPSTRLDFLLTILVLTVGIFLVVYLVYNL